MKKSYKIWSEGFRATGEQAGAMCLGTYKADSFKEAVKLWYDSLTDQYSRDCVSLERLTFWGCRLFDNEQDARRSFG